MKQVIEYDTDSHAMAPLQPPLENQYKGISQMNVRGRWDWKKCRDRELRDGLTEVLLCSLQNPP